MSDRTFIDELITETLPRIETLTTATYHQAACELSALDAIASSLDHEVAPESLDTPPRDLTRALWNAALTDVAVGLLWAVADQSAEGTFTCTRPTIESAWSGIDRTELQRETGVPADDLRFILAEMGGALESLVGKRGTLEITIDRRPVLLRTASGKPEQPAAPGKRNGRDTSPAAS